MTTTAAGTPTSDAERSNDRFLRLVLKLDALATGIVGAGFLALSQVLDDLLGLAAALALPAGVFLLAYAWWVWYTAARQRLSRSAVGAIIIINLLWAAGSTLLAVDSSRLTALGTAFILAQAGAVLVFALLQYTGLRRTGTAGW
jgi:hypothetical protein